MSASMQPSMSLFQSTLPVGGATNTTLQQYRRDQISIHAPRGGSDPRTSVTSSMTAGFQSTLPVGGATLPTAGRGCCPSISIHAPRGGSDLDVGIFPHLLWVISIHAPRGGSDQLRWPPCPRKPNFNPRSPWGERLPTRGCATLPWPVIFQSTLPVGGATAERISAR